MHITQKTRHFMGLVAASAFILGGCQGPNQANHPYKTNHFQGANGYYQPPTLRPRQQMRPPNLNRRPPRNRMKPPKRRGEKVSFFDRIAGNQPSHRGHVMMPQFQQWIEHEPIYQLYPGDQVDIVVATAPELSRTLTVGPDGRILMPMSDPIMAAGKNMIQVQHELRAQLARQLKDPTVSVTPRSYGPQQIYVGGEVGQSGTYTLPGPIGAIEALFMAGGMRDSAKTNQIAVLRRAPNGGMMMRTVNIGHGLNRLPHYNDVIQLRRGDIIFVPKTRLAEIGLFVQGIRGVLPVDFNLSYQFGSQNGGTTVVQP